MYGHSVDTLTAAIIFIECQPPTKYHALNRIARDEITPETVALAVEGEKLVFEWVWTKAV
ncbi:MAG: hypothetical protein COB04_09765 [Gammaproteobacteria bacterium]|nr:MAG: hypothetical protein COB04_14135 [Gammaproteobacteria bacterium]PCJ16894.1 MAG: hypothetical protein COB04_09765 [Gammaproteobacteria bacterium]